MVRHTTEEKMIRFVNELLKDSNRSDRELAKVLGVSQPTISRMRKRVIEEKIVKSYTVIPDFYRIGYSIMVFTLVKAKNIFSSLDEQTKTFEQVREWMMSKSNVVFCDYCRGMGMTGGMISFHKSYQDFDKFIFEHNHTLGYLLKDVQNIIFNLGEHEEIKPFHFKYLVEGS